MSAPAPASMLGNILGNGGEPFMANAPIVHATPIKKTLGGSNSPSADVLEQLAPRSPRWPKRPERPW